MNGTGKQIHSSVGPDWTKNLDIGTVKTEGKGQTGGDKATITITQGGKTITLEATAHELTNLSTFFEDYARALEG